MPMQDNPLDWGTEAKEDSEAINAALKEVRAVGDKKRLHRRSATAGALALIVVGGFAAQVAISGGGTSPNQQVVAPPSTSTTTGPPAVTGFAPTLASEVLAKAQTTYGATAGIQGTTTFANYCWQTSGEDNDCDVSKEQTTVRQFRFRSNGDAWMHSETLDDKGQSLDQATNLFTAKDNGMLAIGNSSSGTKEVSASRGSSSRPFGDFEYFAFGHFTLTSLLDGLAVDQNASLSSDTVNDRPAWSITAKGLSTDAFGASPDEVVASFDKETLFPLEVVEKRHGRLYSAVRVIDLQVNPTFTDQSFVIDTTGVDVADDSSSPKWRGVADVDALKAATSYQPLLPTFLPQGYSLSALTYTPDAMFSGAEGMNPSNKDVVMATYRRGLQSIVVTTRRSEKRGDWVDPLGLEGQQNATDTPVVAEGGAYNDTKGAIVTGFGVTPHVWIVGATLVTTISGDATANELQQMLNSLQRV